jgi:hypothetical protein
MAEVEEDRHGFPTMATFSAELSRSKAMRYIS